MKNYLLILIFTFLSSTSVLAQGDSLVFFNELKFRTSLEEYAFKAVVRKDKSAYFHLLSGLHPDVDSSQCRKHKQAFERWADDFNSGRFEKRKPKKKIKKLYASVHDRFFKKYELNNYFHEVFTEGKYNCVTATGIYAMALEKLNIPYEIKEAPNHVFIIAYPESEKILIESTNPKQGFFVFNDKFKSEYIGYLRESKIISEQEYRERSVDDLFNHHYFKDSTITFSDLLAIQYSNDAYFNYQKKNYIYAFEQFEKSYYLFPKLSIAYMLVHTGAQILTDEKYERVENLDFLIKLSRFKKQGVEHSMIVDEFIRIATIYLTDDNKPLHFDTLYRYLNHNLRDDSLKREIGYIYNFERGRILLKEMLYEKALPYVEEAYKLNPENTDIQLLLLSLIGQLINRNQDFKVVEEKLLDFGDQYPGLKKHNLYNTYLANCYLIQFGRNFDLRKVSEAKKYRSLFEELYDQHEAMSISSDRVTISYSSGATYYYRLGHYGKARSILQQGLKYAPNSYELKRRMELLR